MQVEMQVEISDCTEYAQEKSHLMKTPTHRTIEMNGMAGEYGVEYASTWARNTVF